MFNDPRYAQEDHNVQVPAHLNFGKFMLNFLRKHVLQKGDEFAIKNAETGEKITYKELVQNAVDLAVGLKELGIQKGDIVALGTEINTMFLPITFAIIFTGATFTSFEVNSGKFVLHHKVTTAKPKYFITSNRFWNTNSEILRSVESIEMFIALDSCPASDVSLKDLMKNHHDVNLFEPVHVNGQTDTAVILYSSGTTGMPKGVLLTHLNCILNSNCQNFTDETMKTAFMGGEFYHNYAFFMANKLLCLGTQIVYVDNLTCEKALTTIEKYQVNIAFMVPAKVNWLAKAESAKKYRIDSLKVIYSRSAPLHVKTMDKVKELFPSVKYILQGYGMSESGELTSESWGSKGPKPGSVGSATPGITLKVVHPETRQVLGPNERGEICLKGPVFMKGYIGIEPSTYLDEQGFFKTGDLGYYDEDNYFYVIERLNEVITVYDGTKVFPLELETILLLHPGVREAGVVGIPQEYDEAVVAFVVKQPGEDVTEKDIIDYVAKEVPSSMQLTGGVRFIPEIPRNPVGKILRRRLREMLNETH